MTNMNKFAAQQLTKKQMNKITGGSITGCSPGQKRYSCVTTIDGLGVGTVGYVCAGSQKEAETLALQAQANTGTNFGVVCGDPK